VQLLRIEKKRNAKNLLGWRPLFFFCSAEPDVPLYRRRRGEAQPRLDGLERGVEIAVGGGGPKSHCDFGFCFSSSTSLWVLKRSLLRRGARARDSSREITTLAARSQLQQQQQQ